MNGFTASNGVRVSTNDSGGVDVGLKTLYASESLAVREFFQHERDKQLGRWRWPENPDVVVYLDGHASRRSVTVFLEKTGGIIIGMTERFLDSVPNDGFEARAAARAYFEAHPERKPWHDAKTGEVWVITVDGEESAWTVNNKDKFENPDSTYELTNPTITAARRIWPVSDD